MRRWSVLVALSAFLCGFAAQAAGGTDNLIVAAPGVKEIYGNIRKHSIFTGTAFTYNNISQPGYQTSWNAYLQLPIQYFLIDRLAVGMDLAFYHTSGGGGSDSINVGPAATWFFWSSGRLASYLGTEFDYVGSSYVPSAWMIFSRFGFSYFATPAVAFGPEVGYTHQFQNSNGSIGRYDQVTIGARFSVFLSLF